MKSQRSLYHRHRFPQDVICHAVWLYYCFCLSYRDVEDLLAERGINVSCETLRRWCLRFGPVYANRLRKRSAPGGDQWFVDEVFVRIDGQQCYLNLAVDQDGQVLGIVMQKRRNTQAAVRFFRRLLKQQGQTPRRVVTDKLRSCHPAHRQVMPGPVHDTRQYANNRAELSHEARLVSEQVGCADLNQAVMPSCIYPFTARCEICSQSPVICCGRSTIGHSEPGRLIYTSR